ncbi:MAG: histidinol dehydrogenase, partial [Acidobacteriaceae bacterium]
MKLVRTTGRGRETIDALTERRVNSWDRVLPQARRIVESVRRGGDDALLRLRSRLDGIPSQAPLRIPEVELRLALENTSEAVRQALKTAGRNIRAFATQQRPKEFSLNIARGVVTGQRVVPLDSAGC